jgi:hypothetical protein
MFVDFKHAEESQKTLITRYGEIGEYTPPADGAIPAHRLDAFLEIRNRMDDVRDEMVTSFRALQEYDRKGDEEKSFKSTVSAVKTGIGFGRLIGKFLNVRNEAMLDQDMGLGEYTYIYMIAFHSWLARPVTMGFEIYDDEAVEGQAAPSEYTRRLHDDLLNMLRNQLKALDAAGDPAGLRGDLEAEISRMEDDRRRLPWKDGLPESMLQSLEPYRLRLEESYNPFLGVLELAIDEEEGDFSFNFG